ncbi:DUF58 domain-containing protein [Sulfurimonas sp. SAG-AH-194-C21]|nr:DUF58 domain-containing protein [Sulfurimonas sp. SAG-AH-194-C21]MDF1884422.1 DUF58 domain-containing protein [Sulfurimonas sp. SAG-AH-194-C21]
MKSYKTYISILKTVNNRPTKYFTYLVVIIVSLFLQAYMHNYNIVYLMMFFIVGIGSASSIFGVINLYHVKVNILSHDRFFANESSSYKLSILNESQNSIYDINIEIDEVNKNISLLKSNEKSTLTFYTTFLKRGLHSPNSIKVHSLFPLPHEIKYKQVTIQETLLVYPHPNGLSLFDIYNLNDSLLGEIDEFDGIKNFIQGESASYIHWPSLARGNALRSKNFIYKEDKKTLHFEFDTLSGDVESKLSQLTLWILECEKNAFVFTLAINDSLLDSKEDTIDEILTKIASY